MGLQEEGMGVEEEFCYGKLMLYYIHSEKGSSINLMLENFKYISYVLEILFYKFQKLCSRKFLKPVI